MKVVVIVSPALKEELAGTNFTGQADIEWVAEPSNIEDADIVVDFLFTDSKNRIEELQKSAARCILVNHVSGTSQSLPANFTRFNGWPGFMSGAVVEAASNNTQFHHEVETVFTLFNRKVKWVPDSPGFVTARVVAMIINEAYLALGEGVSSRKDIDTAMKLGTNYPFGPFEWVEKIGLSHVHQLLVELARTHKRYQPAALLTQEALS